MKKGLRIKVTYQRFGAESKQYWFEPYCLKMFNHRWYLLGRKKGDKKLRVLAMDERLKAVEDPRDPADEHFFYPKDFSGKDYFGSSVGVIVNPGDLQPVRIKVFGVQADYWRSAPLHHSQKEIKKANGYSIFELMLNPNSLELEQLLFSKINQIEVLEPEFLRKRMISYIKKMQKLYSI
jgi:predicted DNA-binding transcriptional regulator YafY